ncbi:DUF6929 family protein [Rhizobium sp. G187]|uniref:DUF6929 family protein n=1 Tax=Rhizobium sp. G187 TaxID=3451352 RepID=UPI003EE66326
MIATTQLRQLQVLGHQGDWVAGFISAASGLALVNSTIYVIADDEHHLGIFNAYDSYPGRLSRLLPGELPEDKSERKRQKPDFEAIVAIAGSDGLPSGRLLVFPSGSRPNRNKGAMLVLDRAGQPEGSPVELDMSPILTPLRDSFAEVNIEGAVILRGELLLFQRGHRGSDGNAIVRYHLQEAIAALEGRAGRRLEPNSIDRPKLPSINNVLFGFTDATVLPGGEIVFCAVAENTDNAYNDGPCVGAGVGILSSTGQLLSFHELDRPWKVEGIDARLRDDRVELLMVTDADDRSTPASLLSAWL